MLKHILLTLTICVVVILAIFQPMYAQINEFKITADDGATDDLFGHSVSISGDYAIVGAEYDDDNDNGPRSGSAFVFKRDGTSWTQEAKLLASDGATGDLFGHSVSISGDYAIVGAEHDYDNGTESGSAYLFKRSGTSWQQEAKLLSSDRAARDHFGFSVSISGDYAVVGASKDDDNGTESGSAYIFKRSGATWAQEAKLLASDGAVEDEFGFLVSISGDYAVVGAVCDSDNGNCSGSAYVFKRSGTSWTQEAKLLASDGAVEDFFGASVSISGDYAVVGAPGDDDNGTDAGSAYLFKRSGTSWTQEAKLLPSDGATGDHFGWGGSASISGDYAVVGAWGDDDNGDASGSVYVYTGFSSPVGVESEIAGLPAEFSLSQNYPNPFNPETVIEFALPQSGDVSLVVYNIRGEEVARLLSGTVPAGNHRVSWHASNIASGIYLYKLQAGGFAQTRKMLLLK